MEKEIGLGWKVRDLITGLEGIVNHLVFYAGMGPMAGIVPTSLDKDGKIREAEVLDFTQLQVLTDIPLFEIPEAKDFLFDFGEKVRDTITGFEGKVAGKAQYINGCNRILVQPTYDKTLKEGKAKIGEFFAESVLETVEPPKQEEKERMATTSRGGPADFRSSFP